MEISIINPIVRQDLIKSNDKNMNNSIKSILDKYDKSFYKGPPFILPNGETICEDMWRSSLEMRLDEMIDKNIPLYRFSLNDFFKEKIDLEGTDLQKKYYYNTQSNKNKCFKFIKLFFKC